MPKILHILKEPHSPLALEMIKEEAKNPQQEVLILLIQEAVRKTVPLNHSFTSKEANTILSTRKIYILKEDLEERGLATPLDLNYTCINYQGMLDLIYQADKVVTW